MGDTCSIFFNPAHGSLSSDHSRIHSTFQQIYLSCIIAFIFEIYSTHFCCISRLSISFLRKRHTEGKMPLHFRPCDLHFGPDKFTVIAVVNLIKPRGSLIYSFYLTRKFFLYQYICVYVLLYVKYNLIERTLLYLNNVWMADLKYP